MPQTIGYHLVKSGYGLWLPGDKRGHWSSAWDERIGFSDPHKLHEGDPIRERMARERMTHPPTWLTTAMIEAVAHAVGACERESDWQVAAAAIETTHMHLLLTYTERDISLTAKWIAQQTTKAVHRLTSHTRPVWCDGRWLEFLFNQRRFDHTVQYIERHNLRRGLPAHSWNWITPQS